MATELERLTERVRAFHGEVHAPRPTYPSGYEGDGVQSVLRAKWRVQRVLPLVKRSGVAAGRKLTLRELAAAANRKRRPHLIKANHGQRHRWAPCFDRSKKHASPSRRVPIARAIRLCRFPDSADFQTLGWIMSASSPPRGQGPESVFLKSSGGVAWH